jgi:hypothetical protein
LLSAVDEGIEELRLGEEELIMLLGDEGVLNKRSELVFVMD